MTTIKDISKALNLGVSTVSMALNNDPRIALKTRERVIAKAKELKYVKNAAAVDLKKRKNRLILLVINDPVHFFLAEMVSELQTEITNRGYDFLIATTYGGRADTAKKYIKEQRADAAIICTASISQEFLAECATENFPICVIGQNIVGKYIYSFFKPDCWESGAVVDYLYRKGHRRIAFVKGSIHSLGTKRKYAGYLDGLRHNHLAIQANLIFDAGGSNRLDGYNITREKIIPQLQAIDAVFYSNDEIAIGGLAAFKEKGINVPQDVSLIGANNSQFAEYVSPALTTAGYIVRRKNYFAEVVANLIAFIEGEDVDEKLKELAQVKTEFFIYERETVKEKEIN